MLRYIEHSLYEKENKYQFFKRNEQFLKTNFKRIILTNFCIGDIKLYDGQ